MALEGIELNSGSGGQKIATDTVSGLDFQVVKIGVGADDSIPTSVSAANPMPVDVLSLIPGTGAVNLGKAADAVAGGTDTGVPPLAIRDDILVALTPADGDYVPLRTSNIGSLWVDIHPGSNTFAKKVDDPAGGADKGVAVLAVRDDVLSALLPVEGDYTHLRVNSTGALHVTGGGGGTEYNEDDATPAPIVGTATLIERDDALTVVTPIEGDWIGLRGTAEGALWVQDFNSDQIRTDGTKIAGAVSGSEMQVDIVAALPAGTNSIGKLAANSGVDIGDVDVISTVTPANRTASGTITAVGQSVEFTVVGTATVGFQVTGTFVANLELEGTIDETNWFQLGVFTYDSGIFFGAGITISAPDQFMAATAGLTKVRLIDDGGFTSGTATVNFSAAMGSNSVISATSLLAGTKSIGKLAANSGVDIGDVDVTSLPANASINLNQVGGVAVATGGVAGSQGVGGLAANGAAVVGSPVLVAGSDGTNAETILVSASGKQCFMSSSAASDGSSNSIASPVVSATLSFKQAISNFVFNGTTWDRLRGDTSGLHVSAQPARTSTTDTIAAKLATDAIMDGTTSLTPKRVLIAATASGDTVVVAGVGGKKIRVLSLAINAFGDANVEFQDNATTTSRSGLFDMGTSSGKAKGLVLAFSPVGHFETAVGVGLDINLSAAVTVEGHLVYVEV